MRLIDAEPLIKFCTYCADDVIVKIDRNTMAKMLADAPEIDAVPVVRCKDCKWWADVDGATKKIGLGACCCGNKVMRLGFLTTKDWYCADGERKDETNCGARMEPENDNVEN